MAWWRLSPAGPACGNAAVAGGDRKQAFQISNHAGCWHGSIFAKLYATSFAGQGQIPGADSSAKFVLLFSVKRHDLSFAATTQGLAGTMQKIQFTLDREHVQLNQLLKLTGLAGSGGAGKALVAAGGVTVDGNAEARKTCKIRVGQVVRSGDTEIYVVAA